MPLVLVIFQKYTKKKERNKNLKNIELNYNFSLKVNSRDIKRHFQTKMLKNFHYQRK